MSHDAVRGPSRRSVLMGGAALALAAAPRRARAAEEVSVSVGRQPYAAGNSPTTQYMIDNKLFEKHAADLGTTLTVDWRDYPSAQPQVEAFVSGNLDLGMWGNTPIIRGLGLGQPWSILNVGEGHFRFVVAVRKDSDIRTVADLKGRTVGALLGGDPYNALSQILLAELGSGNPKDHGIQVVNTPTQAQASMVPRGMDAAVCTYPAYLKAQQEIGTTGIINSFGTTEEHYKGPLGEGAGLAVPSVKTSPFYPDGYYLHRSFWMAQNSLIDAHPNVVVAFLSAQQEAVEALGKMEPGAISQLVSKYWGLSPELGAKVVGDELLFRRGWVWATQGDAGALVQASRFMVAGGLIQKPLTWEQVTGNLAKAAPLQQQAYERVHRVPDAAAFTAKDAGDVRGLPVWQAAQWQVPK